MISHGFSQRRARRQTAAHPAASGTGAFVCIIAGLATGLLAGVAGLLDYTDIRDDHPARKMATRHLVLNLVALGMFSAGAGLRYGALDADRTAAFPLMLSLAGLAVLSYSGWLGGHLVYGDGIGVGRHRRRTPLPKTTITVRTSAAVGTMTAVADDAAVGEGGTLRVEINGVVVAIARVGGALYAFQEFCTHRYGPLSGRHTGRLRRGVPVAQVAFRCANGEGHERSGESGLADVSRGESEREDPAGSAAGAVRSWFCSRSLR